MRMGIGTPHDAATILENLDMVDCRQAAEFAVFPLPGPNHRNYLLPFHLPEGEIMPGRVADNPADAGLRFCLQQGLGIVGRTHYLIGQQGGKIVGEDKGLVVGGIPDSARPFIARAEITGGIVIGDIDLVQGFGLALPWPLHPMRGYKNPFAGKEIQATMGDIVKGSVMHGIDTVTKNEMQTLPQTFAMCISIVEMPFPSQSFSCPKMEGGPANETLRDQFSYPRGHQSLPP